MCKEIKSNQDQFLESHGRLEILIDNYSTNLLVEFRRLDIKNRQIIKTTLCAIINQICVFMTLGQVKVAIKTKFKDFPYLRDGLDMLLLKVQDVSTVIQTSKNNESSSQPQRSIEQILTNCSLRIEKSLLSPPINAPRHSSAVMVARIAYNNFKDSCEDVARIWDERELASQTEEMEAQFLINLRNEAQELKKFF
jgi:hypothetical protein